MKGYKILKQITTELGNKIELISTNFSTFQPFNLSTVLVIGVFHGDEPQGKFLIEEYLKKEIPLSLTLPLEGGRVQILPPLPNLLPEGGREQTPHPSNYSTQYEKEYKPCQYSQFALIKAKELRKNCTDAEKIMWELLRAKRFYGLKFKRQQPIGNYIVDFVCFEKNFIIELDGGQHNENQNKIKDDNRTKYLENLGYRVIRFWNNDILQNIEGCIEYIINNLIDLEENCGVIPSPLRGGGLGRGGNICPFPPSREKVRERGILFIPCLNPDGMALGTRTNANGVDLNRNFPTKNWGEDTSQAGNNPSDYFGGKSAGSEIETQFVMEVIEEYKPEKILTLHAPYKVVNYDGPAREWAESISKIIGYPVEESIGYPTPGSFGTYAGIERNIPVITLELDEEIPTEQLIPPVFEIFDEL